MNKLNKLSQLATSFFSPIQNFSDGNRWKQSLAIREREKNKRSRSEAEIFVYNDIKFFIEETHVQRDYCYTDAKNMYVYNDAIRML